MAPRDQGIAVAAIGASSLATFIVIGDVADSPDELVVPVAAYATAGLAAIAVGLWLSRRRPANPTGSLLVLLGLTELLGASANIDDDLAALAGRLFPALAIPVLLHVISAFPAGRLAHRVDRVLVGLAYAVTVASGVTAYVLTAPPDLPLTVSGGEALGRSTVPVVGAVLQLTIVTTIVRLVLRWRRLPGARGATPVAIVSLSGGIALATLVFGAYLRPLLQLDSISYFAFQITPIGVFPVIVAMAMMRGALARTADVSELAAWFGQDSADRPHPRDALASALGDPSVQLVYERPDTGQCVDHTGRPVATPQASASRGVVPVERQHGRVWIVYDAVLQSDPKPVADAAAVAALAIDHERLTAELAARELEVHESRRRIVASTTETRRQIAQDLHDGVATTLLVAAMTAGRLSLRAETGQVVVSGQELDKVRQEIDRAVTDLRGVIEGVMPSLLIEQGLFAAITSHLRGLPLPAKVDTFGDDAAVEATVATAAYFVVTEAVTNALRHAGASRLEVDARVSGGRLRVEVRDDGSGGASTDAAVPGTPGHGLGLTGMRDRVAALGGSFGLVSPSGAGTRVTVELPCAS